MNAHDLGKLLKTARQQINLTQEQLATKLNVTSSAVSKWENGKNLPDWEILLKLSEILHLTLEDIYHPQETLARLETASNTQLVTSESNIESSHSESVSQTLSPKGKQASLLHKFLVIASIFIILLSLLIGIVTFIRTQDDANATLNILPVAFRITEDEFCGTVYEMACVYSGDIDTLSSTSPYIFELSTNWINDTSISQDITLMKVSFYPNEEAAFQWKTPYKSFYLAR